VVIHLEVQYRFLVQAQLHGQAVDQTGTVEYEEGHSVDQDPAYEVGHGGKGLDNFFIVRVSDEVQEDGEGHREPGEEDGQAAHGEGIDEDVKDLAAFGDVGEEVHEPVETDDGGIKEIEGGAVIEEGVSPALEGEVGEKEDQEDEGGDHEKVKIALPPAQGGGGQSAGYRCFAHGDPAF
jgi:hypothetical protein